MGYETYYNGTITLSEKGKKRIEQYEKEKGKLDDLFWIDIEIEELEMSLCGDGKLYDEELQNFCYFLVKIDEDCFGEIECDGEERDDLWKVIIKNGEMEIQRGFITYEKEKGDEFSADINTLKKIYEVTKQKKLMKEIMLKELEK